MGIEILRPWYLLLLPVAGLACFLIDRRMRAKGLKARVTECVRAVFLVLLVLALAGTNVLGSARSNAVWFLLDASDSMHDGLQTAEAALKDALSHLPAKTRAGVIAFGGDAMVETALSETPVYAGQYARVQRQATDVNDALELAKALLPDDANGQIVILTDGQADPLRASDANGVQVDAMICAPGETPDAQLTEISAPSSCYLGQQFTVRGTIQSNVEASGTLILYANGKPVQKREIELRRGENRFLFTDVAKTSGVVSYSAQIVVNGDAVSANNSRACFMVVSGAPGVLLVEGRGGEGDELAAMLDASGIGYERVTPERMPAASESYRRYDAILMCNVDADAMTDAQMGALTAAVRSLGRGLCVFGGDSSYALGAYRGSKLEELLPVTIDVKNKLDMPSLALMLVIDKSGSMTDGQYGTTRLELAKEAAMRAAELLTENDKVGVIAFDDAAKWVVELQNVTDVAAVQSAIGTIRPGGGTEFYTALYNSYKALAECDAQQKHVIFLTDGESGDGGYESVVEQMAGEGITLTTVAVGSGADASGLRKLAQIGKGRCYVTNEFDNIPKIFTKETYLVSGSYVQNRVFTPLIAENSTLTDYAGLPQLTGYLATTEKSLANVALVSDKDEPVLAWWQYGAGRVLAWTSDTSGAWTADYLTWDDGARFFTGMVNYVLPQRGQTGEMTATANTITYKADENAERPENPIANVLTPDGETTALALSQIAPGVYEVKWSADEDGAYAVTIADGDATLLEGGFVKNYSSEYDLPSPEKREVFAQSVVQGGGQVFEGAITLSESNRPVRTRKDITDALLIAALIVFVLGAALQRLGWERALERYLHREKPPKEEKPAKTKPEKAKKPEKKAAPAAGEATDQLLSSMKKRKRM